MVSKKNPVFRWNLTSVMAGLFCMGLCFGEKKPFFVINYDGYRIGQGPGKSEPTEAQVREDLAILAPYTHGIRTYGVSGHYAYLPAIADEMGLDLHLGVWIEEKTYTRRHHYREMDKAIAIVREGHPCIKSIIVGNEFLMRSELNEDDPPDSSEALLVKYIEYMQQRVPGSIIVTTAETMDWWNRHSDKLWNAVDAIYWQAHPFWESLPVDNAVQSIKTHQEVALRRIAKLKDPKKRAVCIETGWPTGATKGRALGSEANQGHFIKNLAVWAAGNSFEFWIFSAFDAGWKAETEGDVGKHWGLWKSDRTPKAIVADIEKFLPKPVWISRSE